MYFYGKIFRDLNGSAFQIQYCFQLSIEVWWYLSQVFFLLTPNRKNWNEHYICNSHRQFGISDVRWKHSSDSLYSVVTAIRRACHFSFSILPTDSHYNCKYINDILYIKYYILMERIQLHFSILPSDSHYNCISLISWLLLARRCIYQLSGLGNIVQGRKPLYVSASGQHRNPIINNRDHLVMLLSTTIVAN